MKINIYSVQLRNITVGIITALLFFLPASTFAASSKVTCTLEVTTQEGTVKISDKGNVLLRKGESIEINWDSSNAKRAATNKNKKIPLSGFATSSPTKTTKYSYFFTSGSKKATCEVTVHVVNGSFTTSSLSSSNERPTISGKVVGSKSVQIKVYEKDRTKVLFTSKVIKVKKGAWKTKISKKLIDGTYDIVLLGEKKIKLNTIAKSTLQIGDGAKSDQKAETTLVVESVPLLIGGTVHAGGLVPISYVQVINVGKKVATLKGFTVSQTGTAPSEAIVSLSTVDDTGTLKSSINGVAGKSLFKNGSVLIPTEVTLQPGEMHLFTIKAAITNSIHAYLTKQLKINIASIQTDAVTVKGAFPIRGTTWTIGN